MINTQLGSNHYITNRSNQDTIHLRPGPGENIVLHGTTNPPTLTRSTFPIEEEIEFDGYQISSIEEILPNDGLSWGLTGQIVKFNKAVSKGMESRYKFITSSAERNSTAWTFEGGFRVFDRDNEQALSFPASEYSWTPTSGCNISTLRNCDIHGYQSRIFIPMNFNAFYIQYWDIPPETMDTFIAYNDPVNVDTIVTQHQAGYGLGQPNQGVSVFDYLMVTWGQANNYFGSGGRRNARIFKRTDLNRVHLPSEGPYPFEFLSDLGYEFQKFSMHGLESGTDGTVMACGVSRSGQFVMYILNSNAANGVDYTDNVSTLDTSHAACWYGQTHRYFVNGENTGIVRIFGYDFTLLHTLNLNTTIWGLSIEENKLVVLSNLGLSFYTIEPDGLLEHFNKPFDSSWISTYALASQHGNWPLWTDIPIDIFKNEILVSSPIINKVFLIKVGAGAGSGNTDLQRIYTHEQNILERIEPGITFDTNKLKIETDKGIHLHKTSENTEMMTFNNPSGLAGKITSVALNTSYSTVSDYRIKYGITPMNDGLSKINQLNPVYFRLIGQNDNPIVYEGFIAHELQGVFPLAVSGQKDQSEYQSIDTNFIIPGIVSAVKELDTLIEDLDQRLEIIENPLGVND